LKNLENRKDIQLLVDTFYKKVLEDEIIGFFFTEIVELDMEKHLPKMYDFWESTLFHKATYQGNPILVHQHLHDKSPIKKEHFNRWVSLYNETIDELFEGEKATLAKQRGLSIATMMQLKIQ
jgi:hemoglobin